MASRNVRCECRECGCIWRMTQRWIDAADATPSCPVCCEEQITIGDGLRPDPALVEAAVAASLEQLDEGLAAHIARQRARRDRLRSHAASNVVRLNARGGSRG